MTALTSDCSGESTPPALLETGRDQLQKTSAITGCPSVVIPEWSMLAFLPIRQPLRNLLRHRVDLVAPALQGQGTAPELDRGVDDAVGGNGLGEGDTAPTGDGCRSRGAANPVGIERLPGTESGRNLRGRHHRRGDHGRARRLSPRRGGRRHCPARQTGRRHGQHGREHLASPARDRYGARRPHRPSGGGGCREGLPARHRGHRPGRGTGDAAR
jgi:hypothetical protein